MASETSMIGEAAWSGDPGQGGFTGRMGSLFSLMLKTSLLTVLTLGIYRFWMKTRVRQYYWSNLRFGGEPFEYTGRGLELFVGFLIAIFFLAIYLFLINFALSFFSLAYWQGFEPAIAMSILAAFPFIPYAQYRAQRYILARTRWRGIRFGLELAAWRYAGRYLLWMLATLLTLGLIWPVADFGLRKFITNRSSYGDLSMRLNGRSGGLYRGFIAPYLLMIATIVSFFFAGGDAMFDPLEPPQPPGPAMLLPVALYIATTFAFIWYGAFRLRYFLNRTEIGDGIQISSALRPSRYLGVTIGGILLTGLIVAIIGAAMVLVLSIVITALVDSGAFGQMPELNEDGGIGPQHLRYLWPIFLIAGLAYVAIFLIGSICVQLFITRPLTAHVADTARIENFDRLSQARQRPEDEEHGAEGFADALDVGAF